MKPHFEDQVIARATAKCEALLAECHQLLEQIAQQPRCLKLLEETRIQSANFRSLQAAAAVSEMT